MKSPHLGDEGIYRIPGFITPNQKRQMSLSLWQGMRRSLGTFRGGGPKCSITLLLMSIAAAPLSIPSSWLSSHFHHLKTTASFLSPGGSHGVWKQPCIGSALVSNMDPISTGNTLGHEWAHPECSQTPRKKSLFMGTCSKLNHINSAVNSGNWWQK